jgi:formylglycine-generating enzyme required for sulfatase activity
MKMRNNFFAIATVALVTVFSCKTTQTTPITSTDVIGDDAAEPAAQTQTGFDPYSESIKGTDVVFNMVPIPGGEYTMGSPAGEPNHETDEGPQVNVAIDPFWMMETEATWDLFEYFIDKDKGAKVEYSTEDIRAIADAVTRPSTPYLDPSFGMGRYGFPAISMTQYSVLNFCKWLSETTGKFYRLPTEAEWEYACRAGTSTAYFFGDDPAQLGEYAWYWGNSDDSYHRVAQKRPNPWGLYDMHGNVSEWTLDQYQADYYAALEPGADNPWRRPTALHPRSVRGGSWYDDPESLRSANRIESNREWQKRDPQIPKSFWWNTDAPFLGFRVVRPSQEMSKEEIKAFFASVLDE